MNTYGKTTMVVLMVFAAVMFCGSFAGFAGQAQMVITALIAMVLWGGFIALGLRALLSANVSPDWQTALPIAAAVLSVLTAFVLGFGAFSTCGPLWLAGFYHWGGLVGSALGLVCWWIVRQFGENAEYGWRAPLISGAVLYVIWGVFWIVLAVKLSGSINTSDYPSSQTSAYRLPFPGGERSWVIQGNNSGFNHNGREEHAWDFRRRCGTPVLAARGGAVTFVDASHSGHGKGKPNNMIRVSHKEDGTVDTYMHIQKDSAEVKPGQIVTQGQELAKVGNVGNSLTGHVHFEVDKGGTSIPIAFNDVHRNDGIPRTFKTYKSENR